MQFIVVLNVIGVFQVELFGVQFNLVAVRWFEFVLLLDQLLKVLS